MVRMLLTCMQTQFLPFLLLFCFSTKAFLLPSKSPPSSSFSSNINTKTFPALSASIDDAATSAPPIIFPDSLTEEWELDCYSRPGTLPCPYHNTCFKTLFLVLLEDGKKLWEVLITDSKGDFKYCKTLASNLVNSRNLRRVIEEVIEEAPIRPRIVRFFRSQMFNMISIALQGLEVEVKPSRRTHALLMWLQQREGEVYPSLPGYNPQLKQATILDYDVVQPDRLPDVLKAESYAFVALRAESFWSREVNEENINKGYLCPIDDMPKEGWIQGITLFSKRAESVAAWMNGLELSHIKADLIARELVLHTDISKQFVLAPLMEAQKKEGQIFERTKAASAGYHFLSIQSSPEAEDVEGFWLLRQFGDNL